VKPASVRAESTLASVVYARRVPEESILYQTVAEHLPEFLAQAEESGRNIPAFVERELRRYLECGILEFGFLRVQCTICKHDRVVAFSCKGRGFCPSCGGRRMADTAAFLVDRVLPVVPVRQWVVSLPIALRYKLAYDSKLAAKVLDLFVRSVFASLRQRARARYGRGRYECGSVTFQQRSGDAINLNPHFHAIVLDGVFDYGDTDSPRFRYLPPPTDAEVERTLRRIVRRLRSLLVRLGLTPDTDADAADPLPQEEPLLAEIYAASVRSRTAIGERAGRGMIRIGEFVDPEEATYVTGPRCASIDGVSLHANVAVPAKDRRRNLDDGIFLAELLFPPRNFRVCRDRSYHLEHRDQREHSHRSSTATSLTHLPFSCLNAFHRFPVTPTLQPSHTRLKDRSERLA
jgi:hypothetical protein